MKNSMSQSALLLGLVLFLVAMSSCSGLRDTSITVMEPAKINFPKSIQSFVVVNGTKPERPGWNKVEAVLTGENPHQDREAARVLVENLAYGINESPRFSALPSNKVLIAEPNQPLNWGLIEKLCAEYNADAVIVLENFDSNNRTFLRSNGSRELRTVIDLALRVYDPIKRKIVDDYRFTERGRGPQYVSDVAGFPIPYRNELTKELGYQAGKTYARQIAPSFVNQPRQLYAVAKGNNDMRKAYRLARNGQWAEAAEIWNELADSDKEKIAARASFNMALASEQIGELANAEEWVDYSDELLNRKINERYARILKDRAAKQIRVDEQLARIEVAEESGENNN